MELHICGEALPSIEDQLLYCFTVNKAVKEFPLDERRVYFIASFLFIFPLLCYSSSHYCYDMIYF